MRGVGEPLAKNERGIRVKLLLVVLLGLLVSSTVSHGYTHLSYDPSVGINATRDGGATGWVARWDLASLPDGLISYWINPNFPAGIRPFAPQDQLIRETQKAFQVWEAIPTSRVGFRFMGITTDTNAFDGKNVVTFSPADFTFPAGFPGGIFPLCWYAAQSGSVTLPDGQILQASFPAQTLDCDLVINPQGSFSTTGEYPLPRGMYDFAGTLTHEIGHVLGLGHSAVGHSTMYGYALWGAGSFFSEPTEDDKIGVSSLYPGDSFLQTYGTIRGVVRGPTGQPIFGAHVVAVEVETGIVVAGTISGLAGLQDDGTPRSYSRTSGDYLLMLPEGEYSILTEPFGVTGQGQPFLSGVFGSAIQGNLFVDTDFAPASAVATVRLAAGGQVKDVNITANPCTDSTPVIDRRSSYLSLAGQWIEPARVTRGMTQVLLGFGAGSNIIRGTRLRPGTRASFISEGIRVTEVSASGDGGFLLVRISVASDTPIGVHLLEVNTPEGITYFPGALRVVP